MNRLIINLLIAHW